MLNEPEILHLLDLTLSEDLGKGGDVTSNTCIPPEAMATATFHVKQKGVIAGLALLPSLFQKIDPRISVKLLVEEGTFQKAGSSIAELSGPARGIMTGERVALNLLQHLSGIATTTSEYVKKVAGHPCAILDSRKTLPGLRALEKYAVRLGGGHNHRFGLDDRFIIKSNHLALMDMPPQKAIPHAVSLARKAYPQIPAEIEVSRMDLFQIALNTPVDALILHNMTPDEVSECVQLAHRAGKKIYFEASVSLPPDGVLAYARAGVDGVCMGTITSSTPALDIGLRLVHQHKERTEETTSGENQPQTYERKGLMSKFFTKRYKE